MTHFGLARARQQIVNLAHGVKGKAGNYYEQIKETLTSTLEEGRALSTRRNAFMSKADQADIRAYEREKIPPA